ncbi:hypothetical protein VTO42DRAFT_258 [Malbranchea cinnamomea]
MVARQSGTGVGVCGRRGGRGGNSEKVKEEKENRRCRGETGVVDEEEEREEEKEEEKAREEEEKVKLVRWTASQRATSSSRALVGEGTGLPPSQIRKSYYMGLVTISSCHGNNKAFFFAAAAAAAARAFAECSAAEVPAKAGNGRPGISPGAGPGMQREIAHSNFFQGF